MHKKKTYSKIFFLPIFFLFPFLAFAQPSDLIELVGSIESMAQPVISLIITIAAVVFIWGIVQFIISADDAKKRQDGQKKIFAGVIAFVLLFSIWGFVNLLRASIGF